MVPKCKFIIGKSKSSRLTLEQRVLGYNRQLTKLNTKVDLISAWIYKKFGVTFLVEASVRVQLKDISKHLKLKSTAPHSTNPGVKRAKQKLQRVYASGGQHSAFDVSAESDVTVDSDSDVSEADHDDQTSVREPVDGSISLEDGEPEMERRTSGQHKRKVQRNKLTRLPLGHNNAQDGDVTAEQRQRQNVAKRNFPAPDKGPQKHSCNCPNCKYVGYKSNLVVHERTHTGVKPFKCTWPKCGKSFSRNDDRTRHRRTHTREKPYICNWPSCDKSFVQSCALQVHKRTHTGDRPFKCGFCDHRFAQGSGLAAHIRVHTGEKPYKCRVCAAIFTHLSSKVQHENTQHRSH